LGDPFYLKKNGIMARPVKNNLDYFSHDKDMRNDLRIKALRRKYGMTGYAVWNMLLEHLTDCDNFEYEYSDLNIELLSGDFDIEPEELKKIISYLLELKLIENGNGLIYSNQHKKRFSGLLSKRKRERKGVIGDDNPQSKEDYRKGNDKKGDENKTNTVFDIFEYIEEQKRDWYKQQIDSNPPDNNYVNLIRILFNTENCNKIGRPLNVILSMKHQLSYRQFKDLLKDAMYKEIITQLYAIQNWFEKKEEKAGSDVDVVLRQFLKI
jgi:hypothetical protein